MTAAAKFDWRYGLRALLGAAFIWAALAKISDVGGFATEIGHYRLLPFALTNLFGMTLVWIELLAGLGLVTNIAPRSGLIIILGLLGVFLVAIGQAIARDLDIECGCFGTSDATRVGWFALGRDIVMLGVGWFGYPRR